ncbi:MAG TPA: transposase [Phycisphaerae bacterium]|nr:transposase [Phycisphaerae bacterium]
MVLASHVIFAAYGFWLLNDPRGSWSDFVGAWELLKFGKATPTYARRSVPDRPDDEQARLAAKEALKYPPVKFTGAQARAVGRGFAALIDKSAITVRACSILPEHVHMVVMRHDYEVEKIVNLLKGEGTRELVREGIHPLARYASPGKRPPKAWARGQWKVFLDTPEDIERAVKYVEDNPVKEGLSPQSWPFVKRAEG